MGGNICYPQLVDKDGNQANVGAAGGLDVAIQDQTSTIVDLYAHEHIGGIITLTAPTALDNTVLNVAAGHGAVIGNYICLKEGFNFYQGEVLAVTANTITLDTPLDFAYTAGATCTATNIQMNVNGTAAVPRIFHIRPNVGVKWDIVRMILVMEGSTAMDSSLFGNIAALTNGIVIRKKDGTYKNIFNAKSNADFANRSFDVAYDDRAGVPAGIYSFRCRRTFGGQSKNGVVIRLDGDLLEDFQILVRDPLAALGKFNAIFQGHIVVPN